MNTARVREKVQSIRSRVTGKSLHRCIAASISENASSFGNDIEAVRAVVVSDDEHAREMRNLSPLSILLSEDERFQVIDDLREGWPV